ncbi:MAG: bacillithiol biosynthesis deacetylase BshB1 [Planctomycetales bacterium]|nr:bacillithiol biosynthesis deacetylase BshB1 [Planctomycetales bacterium]
MMLDVLVVAAHPDDAELGMGGAIAKMIAEGWKVGILDLTSGEPTPHGSEEIRKRETAAASTALGITWRENLGLPNRRLEASLENRAALANVFRRARPRWLFAPFWEDAHPDHGAATKLVQDARFWAKLTKCELEGEPFHPQRIYYYYSTHLKLALQPDFVLDITEQWPRKQSALECYQSQFVANHGHERPPLLERLRTIAAYWGNSIGKEYGEPFATREPLGMSSFSQLV